MREAPRDFGLHAGEEWRVQHQLCLHAQRHALAIVIGPPPSIGGALNTSSGCLLGLGGKVYVMTADHVLRGFERRVATDPSVRWQVSFPSGAKRRLVFDPRERLSTRNVQDDIVAMEITPEEASEVGAPICSTPLGWPPPMPKPKDVIVLSGYPKMYREQHGRQISFPALSAVFEVTTGGEYHLVSQWNREDTVSIGSGEVPPPGTDLGGMSGGPVFLVRDLVYPLVGVTTDFSTEWELLRMAHISGLQLL